MSATIITSIVTAGSNSHATTSAEANAVATDFVSQGANSTLTNTLGVAPSTGSFAVNAQGTPAMFVDVTAGTGWITATPSGQTSQLLRAYMSANYTSYAISANASGSTKYDWIYLKVDPAKAATPASDASDVTALFTSRSSSNSTDNGSPPTYGILLAVVAVANGASSITNANITDSRTQSFMASSGDNGVSLQTIRSENSFDYVASGGCVWSADSAGSTLNGSMTAGVVYIAGKRVPVALVTAHVFSASKDTYVDVDNTGTLHYTEATNNAASAALTSGYLRLAIVVTGGSSIAAAASINQGQETRVLPIASSIPYAVTDSLGNLICPRDPARKLLGHRLSTSDFTVSGSPADITGMDLVCNIPTGRKVFISGHVSNISVSVANNEGTIGILDVTASNTQIASGRGATNASGDNAEANAGIVYTPPASGAREFKMQFGRGTNAATAHTNGSTSNPVWLKVELY